MSSIDDGSANVWRRLLKSFTPGEMTVRKWCDSQGVALHQFYYWRRRIAAVDAEKSENGRWVAVDVLDPTPTPSAPGGVTIRIAGAAIELQSGFDPALLRAVVAALGAQPC